MQILHSIKYFKLNWRDFKNDLKVFVLVSVGLMIFRVFKNQFTDSIIKKVAFISYLSENLRCVSCFWTNLTCLWWLSFKLEPIVATAQTASKRLLASEVVKNDSKIVISLQFPRFNLHKSLTQSAASQVN